MSKKSRFKLIVLTSSMTFAVLAVLLFVNALSLGEYALPGQPFYAGRSNARIIVAFLMLGTVTLSLLRIVIRTLSAPAEPAVERKPRMQAAPVAAAAETPAVEVQEGAEFTTEPAEKKSDADEVLSDTADELRSSVEVIQEELEEIIDEDAPADKEQMQALYEETDRLKKIIEGMEQLSRAQALARSLRKEPVQIEQLLTAIIERTKTAVPNDDVAYKVECEPGLTMTGDPDCLGAIVGNISDNAARSVKGPGSVTLAASRKGETVVFSVKDTGTGIKRAHVDHIFERFFRGTGSGVGMGLAVVKELVDACGGKIQVQTATGRGTTFTVQLPERAENSL